MHFESINIACEHLEAMFSKYHMETMFDNITSVHFKAMFAKHRFVHLEAMFAKYRMEVANRGVDIY